MDRSQLKRDVQLVRAVDAKVVEVLGRTPISKSEEARAKREIYRSNAGLLTAVMKARQRLDAAGISTDGEMSKAVSAGPTIQEMCQLLLERVDSLTDADRQNLVLALRRLVPYVP